MQSTPSQFAPGSAIDIAQLIPNQPQPGPTGSAQIAIHAHFRTPAFDCEVKDRPLELYVGEMVDFDVTPKFARTIEIVECPTVERGSAKSGVATIAQAELTANRLVCSAPGLVVLRFTLAGGWSRDVDIAVFPESVNAALLYPDRESHARRMRLRAIVRDPQTTRETIKATLTNGPVQLTRIHGTNSLNVQAYG